MNSLLTTRWLGCITYEEGLRLQEELVAQKIAGDEKNYLLLLEHEPVYTIGRTQDVSSLGTNELPHPLHRIGRGGQATYHGPGQLVAYPIIDLNLVGRDLHRYLRLLEEVIIQTLVLYQIEGHRREGMTGVWVDNKKIASLGVGVKKWISFHGLALNVCGDLAPFQEITPCGLSGVEMTSMKRELTRMFHVSQSAARPKSMDTALSLNFDQGSMNSYSLDQNSASALSRQLFPSLCCERYEISGLEFGNQEEHLARLNVLSVGKALSDIFKKVVFP